MAPGELENKSNPNLKVECTGVGNRHLIPFRYPYSYQMMAEQLEAEQGYLQMVVEVLKVLDILVPVVEQACQIVVKQEEEVGVVVDWEEWVLLFQNSLEQAYHQNPLVLEGRTWIAR